MREKISKWLLLSGLVVLGLVFLAVLATVFIPAIPPFVAFLVHNPIIGGATLGFLLLVAGCITNSDDDDYYGGYY